MFDAISVVVNGCCAVKHIAAFGLHTLRSRGHRRARSNTLSHLLRVVP